ncbi:carboxynorspermidine decarboxylase [Helicobacter mustelae]|uniref:Carboxynorspermidine/carboxyspermidine decarboxylase n=1 Tax=Helicobacter mustelae (strain ATCC 43772 / CCUG 25715 / CIP 103759 / LMG 18044 / NCTC 12198 / R85-136P) TaxID=679897 RepID=D3UJJ3_HELM1|nr:carboxynorspermidine decarboxylase [Helicobacter mustelae]CBG40669.1 putative carboxynorspermidine decarboxylase, NspC [Helicobacter mustelae 12198]SQH72166.1 carboxynorspermidine decarboxylase, NspC [Helicobacter mustelae]
MQHDILWDIPSPCYVLEEELLLGNLEILDSIQKSSGAKILLALKGYALHPSFSLISQYLSGTTASGIHEARLGAEEFGGREKNKEVCVFSPAYKHQEMLDLIEIATHIIFNSFAQWQEFKPLIEQKNKIFRVENKQEIEVGLRLNPLYSEVTPPIYNPCISGSRLGINPSEFQKGVQSYGLEGISGLHFHTHCEQNSDALARTLVHFERHFGDYIPQMSWINFGGGHHITRKGYDLALLDGIIKDFRKRYNEVAVFLEPGEAVGWESGFLIGEVVDLIHNGMDIAILDVSATAHMPDCLEMPYRPRVRVLNRWGIHQDQGEDVAKYRYRFGGPSCLAGDVIGDYSFDVALQRGDRVIFEDMMHYTIVKNNTFNGIPLPSLGKITNQGFVLLKTFGYLDYKNRNG